MEKKTVDVKKILYILLPLIMVVVVLMLFRPYMVKKINITGSEAAEIKVGSSFKLGYEQEPKWTKDKVEWSSSDTSVMTVQDGVVTVVGSGTATIFVKGKKSHVVSSYTFSSYGIVGKWEFDKMEIQDDSYEYNGAMFVSLGYSVPSFTIDGDKFSFELGFGTIDGTWEYSKKYKDDDEYNLKSGSKTYGALVSEDADTLAVLYYDGKNKYTLYYFNRIGD